MQQGVDWAYVVMVIVGIVIAVAGPFGFVAGIRYGIRRGMEGAAEYDRKRNVREG